MTISIAIALTLVGGLAMLLFDRRKSKLLHNALSQTDATQLKTLRFPFNEVLLGMVLVLGIVLCASKCLSSGQGRLLEFSLGYIGAALTSFGSFQRIRKKLNGLGLPKLDRPVLWLLAGFCIGMAIFLSGMLTAVKAFL